MEDHRRSASHGSQSNKKCRFQPIGLLAAANLSRSSCNASSAAISSINGPAPAVRRLTRSSSQTFKVGLELEAELLLLPRASSSSAISASRSPLFAVVPSSALRQHGSHGFHGVFYYRFWFALRRGRSISGSLLHRCENKFRTACLRGQVFRSVGLDYHRAVLSTTGGTA